MDESQRNVYLLTKIWEIESETTITIHSNMPNPRCAGLKWVSDPRYMGMTNMSNLTTNKQRG
jgi:hypothetical protein